MGRVVAIGAAIGSTAFLVGVGQSPATADHEQTVTAVKGSAFGYYSSISLFGGPAGIRPCANPPTNTVDCRARPSVTLPEAGSALLSDSVPTADARYGPGIFFTSGPITVTTQGTTGPTGSTTSTANIQNTNTSGVEVFTASNLSSTCTADKNGPVGSTTITNGTLQTSDGNPDIDGDETVVALPETPPINDTYQGVLNSVGDNFTAVFNEQIVNPDGSITVNAYHQYANGPTAVGELIVGQVICGVTMGPASHVNSPPVAGDDTYFTPIGAPLTVDAPGVLANDTDANGDALTAGSATDPAGGTVVLNPDGSFTYTADAGFSGTDTFTYTATDPSGASDTAAVSVTSGNRAPTAGDDAYTTLVNTPLNVPAPGVLSNDADDRGDTLTAGSATDPASGTVALNPDGSFTYTPDAGFAGADTFTYTATDQGGANDTATVTVTVGATPGNTPPVANFDYYSTVRNVAITVPAPGVLGNDTDADGDTLTVISATTAPNSGNTVTMNPDGSFTFTPAPGISGSTYIRYIVSDGRGGTDEGFVTITIDPDPRECGQDYPPKLATIVGTEGDDVLVGTRGPDIITGLGGNDTITGLGGNDIICGGAGNDDIDGGAGNDSIEGGDGNDHLVGGAGDDFILGGAGDDDIDGGRNNDFILGGEGNDRLEGGMGDDVIFGDRGDDTVDGGKGNDAIFGEEGSDRLTGGMGDDEIFAGEDWETGADVDECDVRTDRKPIGTNVYYDCEAGAGAPPP